MSKDEVVLKDPDQVLAGVIEVYDNVFSECDEFLKALDIHCQWKQATLEEQSILNTEIRDSDVTSFHPMNFRLPSIFYDFTKVIWTYVNDYAVRYKVAFSGMEHININRYKVGQRYNDHMDDGPGANRVISALLYLNDVEEGGETEFLFFNEAVKPVAGRLVIFPSNYAYTHVAHPPTKGIKYSAAAWFNH